MSRAILLIALVSMVAACASGQVGRDATLTTNDKSIVVMGVSVTGARPDEAKVYLWPGSAENDAFQRSYTGNAQIVTAPVNNYIVGLVDAGDTLALGDVIVNHDQEHAAGISSSGSSHFEARQGTTTIAFDVPGGKVLYVGDLNLNVTLPGFHDFGDGSMTISYTSNYEAAKEYIDTHYTGLKGRLEEQGVKVLPTHFSAMEIISLLPVVQRALNPTWTWVQLSGVTK